MQSKETHRLADGTAIEWTGTTLPDGTRCSGFTVNLWHGCTEQGIPGESACDHCYARRQDANTFFNHTGQTHWGADHPRRFFGDVPFHRLREQNRRAQQLRDRFGLPVRLKVFLNSMSDLFESLPPSHPAAGEMERTRARLWEMVPDLPHINLLCLTKRPQNINRFVPKAWMHNGFPDNVWVGTTVESPRYTWRIGKLCQMPARVRFLSMEPLLAGVDLQTVRVPWEGQMAQKNAFELGINWVLTGGESGTAKEIRAPHPAWFVVIRDACQADGVPFEFKQWGSAYPATYQPGQEGQWVCRDGRRSVTLPANSPEECVAQGWQFMQHRSKHRSGRMLEGRFYDGEPLQYAWQLALAEKREREPEDLHYPTSAASEPARGLCAHAIPDRQDITLALVAEGEPGA